MSRQDISAQRASPPPTQQDLDASEYRIDQLQARSLPQMVNWWDASVLTLVGIRTLISGTIGNYADQRPMQAAADNELEDPLQRRHDYRGVYRDGHNHLGEKAIEDPLGSGIWKTTTAGVTKWLKSDGDAIWVDFIADLGDGYEATYAMAYLLAQDSLTLDTAADKDSPRRETLPAGDILIMGGDLAYPNATIEEYNRRCIDPYDDAFRQKDPRAYKRKLFFIAGNHDWYDGLAAFTSVFCTARDRLAQGKGLTIGGWQTEQRRSYFALALPHGWWFWGVDLALNATIDEAQKNYFEAMSLVTQKGEKVIIIVHAPVWQSIHDSPLHDISQWARKNGAEVVALLAGDLHFYSRFHSIHIDKSSKSANAQTNEPDLDQELQLIVSGGGGAFLHPTHQVPRQQQVHWSVPKADAEIPRDKKGDFQDTTATITDQFEEARPFPFKSPHIYPSRGRSMMLSLKNLLLPFRNRKFALFVGVFYLLYAWVFQITTQDPEEMLTRAKADKIKIACNLDKDTAAERQKCYQDQIKPLDVQAAAKKDPVESSLANRAAARTVAQSAARSAAASTPAPPEADLPVFGQTIVDFVARYPDVFGANAAAELDKSLRSFEGGGGWTGEALWIWDRIYSRIDTKHVINAMLANPAFFFMIIGLYAGLIYYVGFDDGDFVRPKWLKWPVKILVGGFHGWLHVIVLLAINGMLQGIYHYYTGVDINWPWQIFGVALYSVLLILIGGIAGGMLFGVYWVLTSIIGKLHMDSFGALGITGYKNFLRMKVEADKITVYAIGLDKVPGRKEWRALTPRDTTDGPNSLIRPIVPLTPHLIEPPYEIKLTAKAPPAAARPVAVPAQAEPRPARSIPADAVAASSPPDGLPAWRSIWSAP